jgi:hypothetical protein
MKEKEKDYIDEWLEQQEVVYKPSYYRNKIENLEKFPTGMLRITGILNIIPSVFALVVSAWMFYQYTISKDIDVVAFGALFFIIALLGLKVGYRHFKEYNYRKQNKQIKQKEKKNRK